MAAKRLVGRGVVVYRVWILFFFARSSMCLFLCGIAADFTWRGRVSKRRGFSKYGNQK